MAVSVMTWGTKLVPGKVKPFTGIEDSDGVLLKITNACLGEKIGDANGRTLVKITKVKSFLADSDSEDEEEEVKKKESKKDIKKKKGGKDEEEDEEDSDEDSEGDVKTEEFILCSLIPGKIETVSLNVDFSSDLLSFEVIGKNEVHLLGNFIDTTGPETDSEMDMEDMDDLDLSEEEGGAYRLEDVSSDVEVTETRLGFEEDSEDESDAGRFEEITDKKALKRSADAMDEDQEGPASTKSNGTASGELSKKQKKKLAKKLKNEAGEAVAVTTTATTTTVVKEEVAEEGKKEGKKDKKEKKEKEGGAKRTTASGLGIEDTKKGTGKEAKRGSKLSMRYIGKLTNGKIFDKNTGGQPFTFKLGSGEVIKGWDEGLVGMQVGGERVLTVPPELGYGAKGAKPEIPPNATLRFEVKLLEIK